MCAPSSAALSTSSTSTLLQCRRFLRGPYQKGEGRGRQTKTSGPRAYEMLGGATDSCPCRRRARCDSRLHELTRDALASPRSPNGALREGARDEVFGEDAFRGEIIWVPGNGARGRRALGYHQTLLVFSKSAGPTAAFTWNAGDPALREPSHGRASTCTSSPARKTAARFARDDRGKTYRYFADEGRRLGSLWSDIPAQVATTPLRKEATGYPTQKPERLLRAHHSSSKASRQRRRGSHVRQRHRPWW